MIVSLVAFSKRKQKYINRLVGKKALSELARDLNVPVDEIRTYLRSTSPETLASAETTTWEDTVTLSFLLFLVFGAPFPVALNIFDFAEMPKAIFIQTGVLLLTALWLFSQYRNGELNFFWSGMFFAPTLFVIWSGMSIFWSSSMYDADVRWVQWVASFLIGLLVAQITSDERRRERVIAAIFMAGIVLSLFGIVQYLEEIEVVPQRTPPAATFGSKNMAAQFLLLAIPAGIACLLLARDRITLWMSALGIGVLGTFLMYTITRTAWIAMSVEVIIVLGILMRERLLKTAGITAPGERAIAFFAAIGLALLMFNYTPDGWQWRMGDALSRLGEIKRILDSDLDQPKKRSRKETTSPGLNQEALSLDGVKPGRSIADRGPSSIAERSTLYRNTIEIVKDHPMGGVGLANFQVHYPDAASRGRQDFGLSLFRRPKNVHNDFLQVTSELGLVGLFLVLATGTAGTVVMLRSMASKHPASTRIVAATALIALVGVSVNALASFPAYRSIPPFYAAIYFGLAARNGEGFMTGNILLRDRLRRLRGGRWLLGMAGAFFVLFCLWAGIRALWWKADRYYQLQRNTVRAEKWEEVVRWGAKVQRFNPFRKDTFLSSGSALLELRKYKEAVDHLSEYRKGFPHAISNLYYLARCYEQLKDYEEAETLLLKLRAIIPHEGWIHRILGRVYIAQGRKEEGQESLRLATIAEPKNEKFHFYHGEYAYRRKQYEKAEIAFRKALRLKESWVDPHRLLGKMLVEDLGRMEQGREHLERVLQLKPDHWDRRSLSKLIAEATQAQPVQP